jgi:hypothetical protein
MNPVQGNPGPEEPALEDLAGECDAEDRAIQDRKPDHAGAEDDLSEL